MMTDAEHALVEKLGQCWNELCAITGNGSTRTADLREMVPHVHALQNYVLSNSAAREYPDKYRLNGLPKSDE